MLKQLIEQKILEKLSENSKHEHQDIIDYHNEMADEHNSAMHKAHDRLQNPRLSNPDFARLQKKRDAHQEGYAHHITARNYWKKSDVEKAKKFSERADAFDHEHIGKGTFA